LSFVALDYEEHLIELSSQLKLKELGVFYYDRRFCDAVVLACIKVNSCFFSVH